MTATMALAFELDALDVLTEPAAAFEDARRWTESVGVVADEPGYRIVNGLRDRGIYEEDFFARVDGPPALSRLEAEFDTDRLVYVVRSGKADAVPEHSRWECLSVVDAAERAGWDVTSAGGRTTSSAE